MRTGGGGSGGGHRGGALRLAAREKPQWRGLNYRGAGVLAPAAGAGRRGGCEKTYSACVLTVAAPAQRGGQRAKNHSEDV